MSRLSYFQKPCEAGEEVGGRNLERAARFMRQKDLIFIIQYWEAGLSLIKLFSWNQNSGCLFYVAPLQYKDIIMNIIRSQKKFFFLLPHLSWCCDYVNTFSFFVIYFTSIFFCIIKTMLYYFILIYEKNGPVCCFYFEGGGYNQLGLFVHLANWPFQQRR